MNRQETARAIRSVVSDFKPLEQWAESKIAAVRSELESQDASHVALIGRLQGQIQAYKAIMSMDTTTKIEAERSS